MTTTWQGTACADDDYGGSTRTRMYGARKIDGAAVCARVAGPYVVVDGGEGPTGTTRRRGAGLVRNDATGAGGGSLIGPSR